VVTIDASEDLARLEYGEAHIALRVNKSPIIQTTWSLCAVGFRLGAHDR
jgi:hypothetical protein